MIKFHNRNCLDVLRELSDNSINTIITDPPYYSTNLKFDRASRLDFANWLNECKRVLKPNGVLVSFADLNLLIELRSHKTFSWAVEAQV